MKIRVIDGLGDLVGRLEIPTPVPGQAVAIIEWFDDPGFHSRAQAVTCHKVVLPVVRICYKGPGGCRAYLPAVRASAPDLAALKQAGLLLPAEEVPNGKKNTGG